MKISKFLEYTPFLGIIPGAIRLSAVKHKKAKTIAATYLNVDPLNCSKGKEIVRGILSCIPFVNLLLIPLDCGGVFKVNIAASEKRRTSLIDEGMTATTAREKLKEQLDFLYQAYSTEKYQGELKNLYEAFQLARRYAIKSFGRINVNFEKENIKDFSILTFTAALQSIVDDDNQLTSETVIDLIEVRGQYEENFAAQYLKKHLKFACDICN